MDNLPGTYFHVFVASLSETETVTRKHMYDAVAETYTSELVHFVQDDLYPDTEAFFVTDTEDQVSPEYLLSSGAATETNPLHLTETLRVDNLYALHYT